MSPELAKRPHCSKRYPLQWPSSLKISATALSSSAAPLYLSVIGTRKTDYVNVVTATANRFQVTLGAYGSTTRSYVATLIHWLPFVDSLVLTIHYLPESLKRTEFRGLFAAEAPTGLVEISRKAIAKILAAKYKLCLG